MGVGHFTEGPFKVRSSGTTYVPAKNIHYKVVMVARVLTTTIEVGELGRCKNKVVVKGYGFVFDFGFRGRRQLFLGNAGGCETEGVVVVHVSQQGLSEWVEGEKGCEEVNQRQSRRRQKKEVLQLKILDCCFGLGTQQ